MPACLLALTVLGALLTAPTPAGAAHSAGPGFTGAFRLQGSNGYSILVLALGRENGRGNLLLLVSGRGGNVIYAMPATVTPTAVEADLGDLGVVSVELVPSGEEKTVHSSCGDKQPFAYESGSYVGTIDFHGEEGFTQASVSSTPLLVKPVVDIVCPGGGFGESSGPGLSGARLQVASGKRRSRLTLRLNKNRPRARTRFEASLREFRDGIRIERSVKGTAAAGAFLFDSHLRVARVQPPAPFSGAGIFRRRARSGRRWSGNLTVDFPGKAGVPVATRRSHATLVHANRSEGRWVTTKP